MSTDDDKPPPRSPSSSGSPSVSELRAALDSRFEALKGALRGIEYEQRTAREARATDAQLSRGGHEFTQGAIRAHRGETDRLAAQIAVVRSNVSEVLALVRAVPRVEALAVTAPSGITRWEAAGWGIPSPHAVYTFLFVVAEAVRESDFFPVGSLGARAAALAVAAFTLLGINAAKNHLSLQVRTKLRAFDAKALEDVHSLPSHKETP